MASLSNIIHPPVRETTQYETKSEAELTNAHRVELWKIRELGIIKKQWTIRPGTVNPGPIIQSFISERYGGSCWPLLNILSPAMASQLRTAAFVLREIDKVFNPEQAPEIPPIEDPIAYDSPSKFQKWKDGFTALIAAGPESEEWETHTPRLKSMSGALGSDMFAQVLKQQWNSHHVEQAVRKAYDSEFQRVLDMVMFLEEMSVTIWGHEVPPQVDARDEGPGEV